MSTGSEPREVVPDARSFGEYYYRNCCGQPYERNAVWLAFFGSIADRIARDIAPRSVLDAGCAMGLLVETLRDRGIEAFGIDLSSYAVERAHDTAKPFCRVGSIAEPFDRRYDLITCIEVVEHMPREQAERAIANICAHTDDVLFSSTPFDFKEPTHVNVHTPEYWGELFAREGLFRDVDFDAAFVTRWAVRYRRRSDPPARIIRDYERRFWELAMAEADARTHAVELQDRVAVAEAERQKLSATEQELARVNRELIDATERRNDAEADANELRGKLHQALDTIRHMERSAFWRARRVVAKLRGRR